MSFAQNFLRSAGALGVVWVCSMTSHLFAECTEIANLNLLRRVDVPVLSKASAETGVKIWLKDRPFLNLRSPEYKALKNQLIDGYNNLYRKYVDVEGPEGMMMIHLINERRQKNDVLRIVQLQDMDQVSDLISILQNDVSMQERIRINRETQVLVEKLYLYPILFGVLPAVISFLGPSYASPEIAENLRYLGMGFLALTGIYYLLPYTSQNRELFKSDRKSLIRIYEHQINQSLDKSKRIEADSFPEFNNLKNEPDFLTMFLASDSGGGIGLSPRPGQVYFQFITTQESKRFLAF